MVSILPQISDRFYHFPNPKEPFQTYQLKLVSSSPSCSIILFSFLARFKYLFIYLFSFIFILLSTKTEKIYSMTSSSILVNVYSLWSSVFVIRIYLKIFLMGSFSIFVNQNSLWSSVQVLPLYLKISENFNASHSLGLILVYVYTICQYV